MQRLWKSALVLLAGLSVVLPGPVMAGEAAPKHEVHKPAQKIRDVTLDADGVLSGYLVDVQGKPEAAAAVAVLQGRKQVALTKTNAKGQFEVKGLKGGVYQVTSQKGTAVFRVWKNGTAPKQASKLALLVNDQSVVRAQLEGLGLGGVSTTTIVVGGAIVGGVTYAIVEASDNSN